MSYFYGTIQGHSKVVSRLGTPNSGMQASVASLNFGCRVRMSVKDGEEKICIYLTDGSDGRIEKLIATYTKEDLCSMK